MAKFTLLKTEGKARRGRFETVHGTIETPVFMNVGTSAAIKGGISTDDLREVKCQVELSNTYHLHIRPGDDIIFTFAPVMISYIDRADFTNSLTGTDPYLPTPVDSRYSHLQSSVK